ncbi:MAG: MFS transporter [bacterium]
MKEKDNKNDVEKDIEKEITEVSVKKAKLWQLGLFALNNSATNAFHFFMTYIAYFASGVGGVAFVTASYVMTGMRVFDAFTDPVIGFLIDKLNLGKAGKFRPWMLLGNVLMTIALIILIFGMTSVPSSLSLLFFIVCYFIYILGYTCQTACTKAAQSCLTKDPKQRPLISMFDSLFSIMLMGGYGIYVTKFLIPKHGDYNEALFNEFVVVAIVIAFICTILAIISLWNEDVVAPSKKVKKEKIKMSEYVTIVKHNDALRKLMPAAALDKLAALVANNPTTTLILFALIIGNYELSGMMTFFMLPPMIVIISIGTKMCQKHGMRNVILFSKSISVIMCSIMFFIMMFADISYIKEGGANIMLYVFLFFYICEMALRSFCTSTFTPMIADCIDYEQSITGNENPAMIGTMYSLVDKFVSSLSATVAALAVAAVGFKEVAPSVNTELTTPLYIVGILLVLLLPIISNAFTIVQMLMYPLSKEKMEEIQCKIKKEV